MRLVVATMQQTLVLRLGGYKLIPHMKLYLVQQECWF
jgi:uncharacterized membrane protein